MDVRTTADAGAAVRSARVERGWSQAELALRLRVTQSAVSRMESARTADLRLVLDAFDVLGVRLHASPRDEVEATARDPFGGLFDGDAQP